MSYRVIFSSHTNLNLSGVAKFNAILGRRLGTESLPIAELQHVERGPVLLSLKVAETDAADQAALTEFAHRAARQRIPFDLFLHNFNGLPVEQALIRGCRTVLCGNHEIVDQVAPLGVETRPAWCPQLVDEAAQLSDAPFLFSFGMAHKIQAQHYRRLATFLEALTSDYKIRFSTAFHEKANFGDFDSISGELVEIFGDRLEFLGFLSDAAVNYFVARCQLFVAFFPSGVRANNTSIYAAMARGKAILTNLDEFSPTWMQHGANVLDLSQLTIDDWDPENIARIGERGRTDVRERAGWSGLEALVRETATTRARESAAVRKT